MKVLIVMKLNFLIVILFFFFGSKNIFSFQPDQKTNSKQINEKIDSICEEFIQVRELREIIFDYLNGWDKSKSFDCGPTKTVKPDTNKEFLYSSVNYDAMASLRKTNFENSNTSVPLAHLPKWFTDFAVSENYLTLALENKIMIHDKNTLICRGIITDIPHWVMAMTISPNEQYLAFGVNFSKELFIWNINEKKYEMRPINEEYEIKSVNFTCDNQYLISLIENKTVNIYTTNNWQLFKTFVLPIDEISINCSTISPDCKYIAINFKNSKTIKIIDMSQAKLIQEIHDDELEACQYIHSLAFSNDNQNLYVATDHGIKTYNNDFLESDNSKK